MLSFIFGLKSKVYWRNISWPGWLWASLTTTRATSTLGKRWRLQLVWLMWWLYWSHDCNRQFGQLKWELDVFHLPGWWWWWLYSSRQFGPVKWELDVYHLNGCWWWWWWSHHHGKRQFGLLKWELVGNDDDHHHGIKSAVWTAEVGIGSLSRRHLASRHSLSLQRWHHLFPLQKWRKYDHNIEALLASSTSYCLNWLPWTQMKIIGRNRIHTVQTW